MCLYSLTPINANTAVMCGISMPTGAIWFVLTFSAGCSLRLFSHLLYIRQPLHGFLQLYSGGFW